MKIKRGIIVMLTAFTLTGCESSGKVNDKSYLRALTVSGSKKVCRTMEFFGNEESISACGYDIDDAFGNAEILLGNEIFTGYTELIVLDNCDDRETLVHMFNELKVSPDCLTACGSPDLRKCSAEQLEGSVKQAEKQKLTEKCDIITVLSSLIRDGEAYVPLVSDEGFCGNTVI